MTLRCCGVVWVRSREWPGRLPASEEFGCPAQDRRYGLVMATNGELSAASDFLRRWHALPAKHRHRLVCDLPIEAMQASIPTHGSVEAASISWITTPAIAPRTSSWRVSTTPSRPYAKRRCTVWPASCAEPHPSASPTWFLCSAGSSPRIPIPRCVTKPYRSFFASQTATLALEPPSKALPPAITTLLSVTSPSPP
jgi:hypothetical protein